MALDPIRLPAPPALRPRDGGGVLLLALPALGGVGSTALVAATGLGATGATRMRSLLAAGLFLLITVGFVVLQLDRQRRQRSVQEGASREDHLVHLARLRKTIRRAADAQRATALDRHPAPESLPWVTACRPRPTPSADGSLLVRHGTTRKALASPLVVPDPVPGQPPDPVSARALARLVETHREQPGIPALLDFAHERHLVLTGEDAACRRLARALVCSAALAAPPSELLVAALVPAGGAEAWEWLKWLPHHRSPTVSDAIGPRRLTSGQADDLAALLGGPAAHVLLLADPGGPSPTWLADHPRHTVISVGGRPSPGATILRLDGGRSHLTRAGSAPVEAVPDGVDIATAESLARILAGRYADGAGGAADLPCLLSADGPHRQRLRVPIGTSATGSPVHLDLREAAEGGNGPHGLVIGATGSGKSELLRTLVTGLAMTHPPEELNLVLVDFKGGATFGVLGTLPHAAATITNLASDLALVDRMTDALEGELVRRQEILRAAGDLASVRELPATADKPVLPSLLVVVDEFSELLAARPELTELFVRIGRLGRSLGVHLLLASQRLDEGRLRGLEAHLGYRIALRTFSAAESRAVLGVADAHDLPATPGVGFLRTGPDTPVRFRAAQVSAPTSELVDQTTVHPFGITPVDGGERIALPSVLERAVARIRQTAGEHRRARPIWLPPLSTPVALAALFPDLFVDEAGGLFSPFWRTHGPRSFPVGIVDRPRDQRHDAHVIHLDGATGHAVTVGAPRSGKSTLLATIALGLALTSTPAETQLAVIDLGDGVLAPLADLPHTIAYAGRGRPERVHRIASWVVAEAERRTSDSVGQHPHLVVLVDGWGAFRDRFPDLEAQLSALAQQSLAHGIHLVLAANRWHDLRPVLLDVVGTRLELRLGDPATSQIDRRTAGLVPAQPGRGLTPDGHHLLTADPGTAAEMRTVVERIRSAWPAAPAPRLGELPARIDLAHLRVAHPGGNGLLLGVDEDGGPVRMDLRRHPHLLAYGDAGSGRTALLRVVADEIARHRTPGAARLLALDPTGALDGRLPASHLLDHVGGAEAGAAVADLADELRRRGTDRRHTAVPEVWVLVDDLDLLDDGTLDPLVPLLPQVRRNGLHLVVTRRARGAAASRDRVIHLLRSLGTATLLLDGPPDEGPLAGRHRPRRRAPGRALWVSDEHEREVQLAWPAPTPAPTPAPAISGARTHP